MDDDNSEAGAFKTENSEAWTCFKNIDFSSETFDAVAAIYSNDEIPNEEDVDIYESVEEFLSVHIPLSRKKSSAPSSTIPSCNTQILVDSETENVKEKEMVTAHEVTKKIQPVSFQSHVQKSGSVKVNRATENSQEKKKTTIEDAPQTSMPEAIISQSGSQQETVQIQEFKEDKGSVGHSHRPRKQRINVITQMENGFQQGPLSILRRSVMDKIKVHVWTRSVRNIRGICTGFVVAFDKHMNMALMDVDEIYRKPAGKHKKANKKKYRDSNSDSGSEENEDRRKTETNSEDQFYPATPWKLVQEGPSANDMADPGHSLSSSDLDMSVPGHYSSSSDCSRNLQGSLPGSGFTKQSMHHHFRDTSRLQESYRPFTHGHNVMENVSSAFSGMHLFQESKVSKLLGVKTRKLLCRHLNQVLLRGDHVVAVALAEL